jgi:hypothetical protein
VTALHLVLDHESHPHRDQWVYHDQGAATLVMPDGSLVSLSHRAPAELALSMTLAVIAAWDEEDA